MQYRKLKFEHILVIILVTIISSVVLWFVLDLLNIQTAIEISVLVALAFVSGIIIYSLHGRGILPEPDPTRILDSAIVSGRYFRRKFRNNDFSRVEFRTSMKKQRSKAGKKDKQNFQYQRHKYRI